MTEQNAATRQRLVEAHETLVRRDEEIERLERRMADELLLRDRTVANKDAEMERRGRVIDDLQLRLDAAERALDEATRELASMRQTRVWRTGERMWRIKARFRGTPY
ncbi:MAG TPA: hypothetical protein VFU10_11545 [Gaiellaceae bacterium]|nr:hypothetical protein [Gaiellaceae bacterium]